MPIAQIGNQDTSTRGNKRGEYRVKFLKIADGIMRAKKAESDFPDSLRMIFSVVNAEGNPVEETVSYGVAINGPAQALFGFVDRPWSAPVNDEYALRHYISQNAFREVISVYVNGFVRSRLAEEGEVVFEKIQSIWRYTKEDGEGKVGFTAVTRDGLTTTWNCREPVLEKRIGDTPDGDFIGPVTQLNPNQRVFEYLGNFGLKWSVVENELATAQAYWPGHVDANGQPVPCLFTDFDNPWLGFLQMIERNRCGNPVQMEIVRSPKYGLGPRRVGNFPIVKMVPILRPEDELARAEFVVETTVFLTLWDNLAKVLFANDTARFMVNGKFTEQFGRPMGTGILAPLVRAYPKAVKTLKKDGTPQINLPPDPDSWHLDGLVCLNYTAERLVALSEEARFNIVNLSDPTNLLEWVKTAVPEWGQVGSDEAGGETL